MNPPYHISVVFYIASALIVKVVTTKKKHLFLNSSNLCNFSN